MLWISFSFVAVAAIADLARREIPDWLPIILAVIGCLAASLGVHPSGWLSMGAALAVAFGLGAALFALGAWGGGDVKLLMAIALATGWSTFLWVLLWTALIGGIWSGVAWMAQQREIAYGPSMAVALGGLCVWTWL